MKLSKTAVILLLATFSAAAPRAAMAQDSLETARDLYASASYDEALGMLTRLGGGPEHAMYEVFCLIALDRSADAEQRIEEILEADPLFAPNSEEASPRVQEMFNRVRTAIAPRLARAVYADAKAAFERKDRGAALKKFELLLQVIERTGAGDNTGEQTAGDNDLLGELKLLASGFVALAKAGAPPSPAVPPTPAPDPAPLSPPPNGSSPVLTPPVPLAEVFPRWEPPGISRGMEFTGTIRVRISAAGAVESAEIVEPIHPAYDRRLLDAASQWRYEPARREGVAVGSERLVAVRLK